MYKDNYNNIMKRLIIYLFIGIQIASLISCQKELVQTACPSNDLSFNPAEQFSIILSKAVLNDSELRRFIKEEALYQFDNDYDVFYPWIKDKIVYRDYSFRDILSKYDSDNVLNRIEKELPLLNIYIPDWSWLGAFSVNSWDLTDTDIIISYDYGNIDHPIIYNGSFMGYLESGLFPTFPVMIVKNNERMTVTSATRSGDYCYDYSEDVFKPNNDTRVEIETTYIYPATAPGSNFVNASSFSKKCPESVAGWNEYGLDTFGAQRNFVYYNIPKGSTVGTSQNPKIREGIVAIRLNNYNCLESGETNDPKLNQITKKDTDFPSTDDILNAIWSDGQLEIQLYATTVKNDEIIVLNSNSIPVKGKDIFDISKIQRDFYHKTLFSKRKYVYIPDKNNLLPKWYYLTTPLKFKQWNPSESSTIINIHAYEVDESYTVDVTENFKKQKGLKITGKIGDKLNFDFDFGAKEYNVANKYTIKKESDSLGETQIHFDDYIIRSASSNTFELEYYSTSDLDFIMVPLK